MIIGIWQFITRVKIAIGTNNVKGPLGRSDSFSLTWVSLRVLKQTNSHFKLYIFIYVITINNPQNE